MKHLMAIVSTFTLFLGVGHAQNLVRNGDFRGGTSAWTLSGYALDAKVGPFDTTGVGVDNAFQCVPGQKAFATPIRFDMTQTVLAVRATMEFSVDLASMHNRTDPDGGQIEVFFAGQKIAAHAFGQITNTTKRERLCVRFTPTTVGPQALRLSLYRNFIATVGLTPRFYVDNVSLRLVAGPSVCIPSDRKILTAKTVFIEGTPNCAFALLLAPRGSVPIPIPGFGGALEVDVLTLQLIVAGVMDAKGVARIPVTAPASVAGVPLYWQAISVCPSRKDFGAAARIGFYK